MLTLIYLIFTLKRATETGFHTLARVDFVKKWNSYCVARTRGCESIMCEKLDILLCDHKVRDPKVQRKSHINGSHRRIHTRRRLHHEDIPVRVVWARVAGKHGSLTTGARMARKLGLFDERNKVLELQGTHDKTANIVRVTAVVLRSVLCGWCFESIYTSLCDLVIIE